MLVVSGMVGGSIVKSSNIAGGIEVPMYLLFFFGFAIAWAFTMNLMVKIFGESKEDS